MKAPHNHNNATEETEQWTVSSSSSSSLAITDLPSHILMEILLRLPIKILVTTKSVCRSWFHLINDPDFSKLHHLRAKVEVCFLNYNEEKTSFRIRNKSHTIDLLQLPQFRISSKDKIGDPYFVNSCNGLLCHHDFDSNKLVIWNPITSEYIIVPQLKTNIRLDVNGLSTYRAQGLGFSPKENRFKLVRLMGDQKKPERVGVAEICTIEKGSSWRTIGPLPGYIWKSLPHPWFCPLSGTFLQGAIHWFGVNCVSEFTSLVSFNFDDEKLGIVPLPPQFNDDYYDLAYKYRNLNRVGELRGCLVVTHNTDQGVSVWLMKEYGVRDSWTQVCCLKFTRNLHTFCLPISYMDSGKLLMVRCSTDHKTCLILYDSVLEGLRVLGDGRLTLRVIAFSPSLVRLKNSMMEYGDVHVTARSANAKRRQTATSPSWWKSMLCKNRKPNSTNSQRSGKTKTLCCIFLGGLVVLFLAKCPSLG